MIMICKLDMQNCQIFPHYSALSKWRRWKTFRRNCLQVRQRRKEEAETKNSVWDLKMPNYNLGQNRWEFCTPIPHLPRYWGLENGAFWLLRGFIFDFGGWGFAVPFYSVRDCSPNPRTVKRYGASKCALFTINCSGRLLNFWTLREGAYSRLGAY